MNAPRLSVVVPAFNEEHAIEGVVADLLGVLRPRKLSFELVVVDDASTDATPSVLARLRAEVPELRVVTHPCNQGWASTSRSGIAAARGELIAHFAGDGEANAADIPKLLAAVEAGADIALGVRRCLDYSAFRLLQHGAQRLLVRWLFGLDLEDTGGPKLAKAHIWKRLPGQDDSAIFLTERLLVAQRSGVVIEAVEVSHRWRKAGRSAFSNPRRSLEALRDLLRLRFSRRSRVRLRFDLAMPLEPNTHSKQATT